MAISFPTSPSLGDTYTIGNTIYTWDGVKWTTTPIVLADVAFTGDYDDLDNLPTLGTAAAAEVQSSGTDTTAGRVALAQYVALLGATSQTLTGYTKLGSDAPAMKFKKITGTTPDTEGGSAGANHGLTLGKIIGAQVFVSTGTSLLSPGYTRYAGYQFDWSINATLIAVVLSATNSENILSKTFIATIWYEE